nr:uncharacterized protein LOC124814902 [Hydra vulgaris]
MDYDTVCSMKVEELKSYLRLRGLKISGKKEILAARVYCAMENNVTPIKTAEEVEHDILTEYKKKLFINGVELPDPFKLSNGWLSEDEGLTCWPTLLYSDIYNYLLFNPAEIASKDLSDYKTCKAYSYFKCGWLEPLFYHQIGIESEYCYLKGNCRKSEKINDPFHKLWIIINKKTAKIISAHCTCLAGLLQTCNHVAASLFRIEAAVRNGLTNVACTSSKSEWLPNRSIVAPTKICDLKFDRDEFGQRGRKKRSLVSNEKRNYSPLVNCDIKLLNLTDIAKAIETVAPHSIITSAVPKPEIYYMEELIVFENVTKPTILTMDDIIVIASDYGSKHK